MPTSTKPKSQPGKNGPEDNSKSNDNSNPKPLLPPPSEKSTQPVEEPVAPVAEDSGEALTVEEVRILRKMNKSIMETLGLKAHSRSFRV